MKANTELWVSSSLSRSVYLSVSLCPSVGLSKIDFKFASVAYQSIRTTSSLDLFLPSFSSSSHSSGDPEGRFIVQEAVTGHLWVPCPGLPLYDGRAHLINCPLLRTLQSSEAHKAYRRTHTYTHTHTSNQLVLRFIQPRKLGGVSLPEAN